MKLALNASVVSSKRLAAIVWAASAVVGIVGWPWPALESRLFVGAIGLILGAVLAGMRWWFVSHPVHEVLQQLQATLQMSRIVYDVSDRSITVRSTGTTVNLLGFGPVSLVSFGVRDPRSNKERFLLEVLTKYLRFIGKRDEHG